MDRKQQPAGVALVVRGDLGQMNLATFKAGWQIAAGILHQANIDTGVATPVSRDKRGKQRLDGLRDGADPEQAGVPGSERARPLAERLGVTEQAPAALQQVLALRRQLEAPPNSIEQPHAQLGFERKNLA
jgi:hypothetical protein